MKPSQAAKPPALPEGEPRGVRAAAEVSAYKGMADEICKAFLPLPVGEVSPKATERANNAKGE